VKSSYAYEKDAAAIYRRSFAIIRSEADLARFSPIEERVAVRVIHACGMVEAAADLVFSPSAAEAARVALRAGAPIFCDARMVAEGVTRARLPANNNVICTLGDPSTPELAARLGTTRTAAAIELWLPRLGGSVVAIGNAPTALFRLLEVIGAGAPRPAAIIGMPVGFVGAAESKDALIESGLPTIAVRGRKGGSAMAAAAVTAFGRLYGVGIGPGDPDLLTVKATKVIAASPVVAFFAKAGRRGNARAIVDCWLKSSHVELPLYYPMTDETHFDDPPYREALARFYKESTVAIAAHLEAGRDVALLSEGDPMLYGSFMHLFVRLRDNFDVSIVPGVSSICGAWGAAAAPMTWGDDALVVLPATLPLDELKRRLALADAAVIMKVGRNFSRAKQALIATGMAERAIYVERATMTGEVVTPLCQKQDDSAPYFSLILAPGRGRRP
jgi:precorrin-2/cobalt-factor-2 C20-methyltransferase